MRATDGFDVTREKNIYISWLNAKCKGQLEACRGGIFDQSNRVQKCAMLFSFLIFAGVDVVDRPTREVWGNPSSGKMPRIKKDHDHVVDHDDIHSRENYALLYVLAPLLRPLHR